MDYTYVCTVHTKCTIMCIVYTHCLYVLLHLLMSLYILQIYWNEYTAKSLKKASLSNPSDVTVLVSSNISFPEGLTLDWIHQRLYWVDDGKNTVEVVNTDGTDRRVLTNRLSRPRDIVVDPLEE